MQIESLEIRNYRLFRSVQMSNLSPLTVIVGPNGSGKSTLFDVFSFLKDALNQNVAQAVARRGGFRELISREQDGPIAIVIKFRESSGRLATYMLEVAEEFRDYARRGGQVFISTHSPDFLNAIKLEEIHWLAKREGFTVVHRASASENQVLRNLVQEGDLPGALWKQGLFQGAGL